MKRQRLVFSFLLAIISLTTNAHSGDPVSNANALVSEVRIFGSQIRAKYGAIKLHYQTRHLSGAINTLKENIQDGGTPFQVRDSLKTVERLMREMEDMYMDLPGGNARDRLHRRFNTVMQRYRALKRSIPDRYDDASH